MVKTLSQLVQQTFAGDPAIAARLGLTGRPAVEVFAALRRLKDDFR